MPSSPQKIFQIGFNKCGTTTLHEFFVANGLQSCHWLKGNIAKRIYRNVTDKNPILHGLNEYDCFTDMEFLCDDFFFEGYKFFREFYAEYPDSYYILNTRNVEGWIKSRRNFRRYNNQHKKLWGICKQAELEALWHREWQLHHDNVIQFFGDKKDARFLVFDIENDPAEKLVAFLTEFKLDAAKYKHIRKRHGIWFGKDYA